MIASATDDFNKAIAARLTDAGQSDLRQQLVKFYDPETVKAFTRGLIKDKDEQLQQTKAFRDELLAELGDNGELRVVQSAHYQRTIFATAGNEVRGKRENGA